jgi:polyvinyl alcohol dehydrogenase (cytochrome)
MYKPYKKLLQISLFAITMSAGYMTAKEQCPTSEDNGGPELKGQWPLVGGDNYSNLGINFKEHKINVDNVSTLTLAWQNVSDAFSGVAVQSQPVIAANVAYYATSGGDVTAVNAKTGALIWNTNIPGQLFVTSPCITNDRIYVSADTVFSLDIATGAIDWSTPLFEAGNFQDDYSGNPTIVGNKLIVGVSSSTYGPFRGKVVALNRHTGEELWHFFTTSKQDVEHPTMSPGVGVWSTPAIDIERGIVFVGSGQGYSLPEGSIPSPYIDALIALDLHTGDLLWKYQYQVGDIWNPTIVRPIGTYDHDVGGHPCLFSVKIKGECIDLVGAGCKDGTYRIFKRDQHDPNHVEPLVQLQLDPGASIQGIGVRAIAYNGILYVSSTALLSEDGKRVSLDYALVDPNETLTDILTKTSYRTRALNIKKLVKAGNTGGKIPKKARIWKKTIVPGIGQSNPLSYANGVLYQTSWTGYVRAIDAGTGNELWRVIPIPVANPAFPIPAFCATGVTIVNGRVYVGLGFESGNGLPGGGVVCYEIPANT